MARTKTSSKIRSSAVAVFISCMLIVLASATYSGAAGTLPQKKRERTPAGGRTLVFSRGQFKYPLYGNYTRRWLDRPLLHDRSLLDKDEPYLYVNFANFTRMVEIARSYELDGFAFFPGNPGMHFTSSGKKTSLYEFSDRAYREGFGLLPEFVGEQDAASYQIAVAEALSSKSVVRIGGKVLITSYVADAKKPDEWKAILADLRTKHGDTFVFLPDLLLLAGRGLHEWATKLDAEGSIPESDVRAIKAYLRSYLDVCDGLYFAGTGNMRTKDRKFDMKLYHDIIIPLYQSVLAEPAYESKYLGLSAAIGYFHPETGSTTSEDGTKTLRRSFEAAMAARPDVINMPEWDEENENTCICPTVFNSFSTQRIIRCYMRRIKGLPPAPNPGDDASIPNLIVSYRKLLTLGERLEIELLNVPDSERRGTYTVTVALKDLDGRIVKRFPAQTLAAQDLADQTLVIPTEELAAQAVLIPSLAVTFRGQRRVFEDGLHYIHLRPTWNWDLKWVKQPLRDLCVPTKAAFALAEPQTADPAERMATGSFACDEKIAFLEALENDDVVYAAGPQDEYLRSRDDVVLLSIERRALRRVRLTGTVTVLDGACRWLGEDIPSYGISDADANRKTLRFDSNVDGYVRCVYLAIRKSDADKATIVFDSNQIKARVPVKQVLENEIYSETHEDGLSLTFSRYCKQPRDPYRLNQQSASFSAPVRPEMSTSVFHMRAITESGKFYFGRPIALQNAAKGKKVLTPVYSDTAAKPVAVEVNLAQIPDVSYEFTPERGAVLYTPAGRPFWGILGGYTDTATGRGGQEGVVGTPFYLGTRNYPQIAHKTAPNWVDKDGTSCLKFDGIGNYVLLPIETLPRRAGFTLSFEIKPASSKPQVLFICHSFYVGSLAVRMNQGTLSGTYYGDHRAPQRLAPGLSLDIGKWSKVEVIYDQAAVRFRVNGKESAPIPCPGPGLYIGMSVFGGFGAGQKDDNENSGWFEGYLRSLQIRHACPVAKRRGGSPLP